MFITIPSNPVRKVLDNGCFYSYDGRKTLLVGMDGLLGVNRYSVNPGERVVIEQGVMKVMTPPIAELPKIAWKAGFFGNMQCADWEEMHKKVYSKTFYDSKWGKERPTARVIKGNKCAVARCQVPGLDFGKPMFWMADKDCEPKELERILNQK